MKILVLISWGMFFVYALNGQGDLYDISEIQDIRIEFEEENWDAILDSLYVEGQKSRLLGSVVINGTRLDSVGIRYKGFSSVSVDRKKNPFNIKLDYINDQDYKGFNKLKLGNVIHDPSFVREALSYAIARKYMPASEANYARVYVNDEYFGLYSNVESVNKDFTEKHFGSRTNPFFKGNPEALDLNGANANLSNRPGTDTTAYFDYYQMESDEGWSDLVDFIQVLNESPGELNTSLDIDRALWMHAFNYCLVNVDSYIGYAQNYYLYKDDRKLYNTIPWDLNMSFGSFRITDASEFFDGFNIDQAKTIDPLAHFNSFSVHPRPLMRQLFANDLYRKMYLAHIRTLIEDNFANGWYLNWIASVQDNIESSVVEDENKFYTTEGFRANIESTYTDLISYPGIKELMDGRIEYLRTYPGYDNAPEVISVDAPISEPLGSYFEIKVVAKNAARVYVGFRESASEPFILRQMEMLNDSTFRDASFLMFSEPIDYYFFAENEEAGTFYPTNAAYNYFTVLPEFNSTFKFNDIVINEFMAKNSSTQTDEQGEYEDWVEIYNTTNAALNLNDFFLSDKEDVPFKWNFPDTIILSNEYMIVWADEDQDQGPMHANFKLSGEGERLSLIHRSGMIMDSISYGVQEEDISIGRLPNATGPFGKLIPTFQGPNQTLNTENESPHNVVIYPNPCGDWIYIELSQEQPFTIQLVDHLGRLLKTQELTNSAMLNMETFDQGVYYLLVNDEERFSSYKIIKHDK